MTGSAEVLAWLESAGHPGASTWTESWAQAEVFLPRPIITEAEADDVLRWLSGIGQGVATGAISGAPIGGPWGALIGGLLGGGLGAVQTAMNQPAPAPRPTPAPLAPTPVAVGTPRPMLPPTQPQPPSPPQQRPPAQSQPPVTTMRPVSPSTQQPTTPLATAVQDLLPMLTQLIAALESQNTGGREALDEPVSGMPSPDGPGLDEPSVADPNDQVSSRRTAGDGVGGVRRVQPEADDGDSRDVDVVAEPDGSHEGANRSDEDVDGSDLAGDQSDDDVTGEPPAAMLSIPNPDPDLLRGLPVPPGLRLDW